MGGWSNAALDLKIRMYNVLLIKFKFNTARDKLICFAVKFT